MEEACELHCYIIVADLFTQIHTMLGAGLQIPETPEKKKGQAPAVGLGRSQEFVTVTRGEQGTRCLSHQAKKPC